MTPKPDKYTRRRLRSSYISVVVIISLVLYLLGVFGLLIINASSIARQVKENFEVTVLLENEAAEVSVRQFQKSLQLAEYVKSTEYVSREEAAAELREQLDEDFMDFLGYNPLLDAIVIHLHSDYVNPQQLEHLEKEFAQNDFVREVIYDKPLIQMMNDNIERIGFYLLLGCILLTLIAIGLINSSIRLSIYSKRFLIKTMQLVGATTSFIRQPFIWRSFRHGLYGAAVASVLLLISLYNIGKNIPDIREIQDPLSISLLIGGVVIMGIVISMISTYFALRKYLKLKTDQLYY